MCRRSLSFVLSSVCIFALLVDQSYAQGLESKSSSNACDSLQTKKKTSYITPYLGGSTLVGNFGIEFQYRNYGLNIGLLKSIDVSAIENI